MEVWGKIRIKKGDKMDKKIKNIIAWSFLIIGAFIGLLLILSILKVI